MKIKIKQIIKNIRLRTWISLGLIVVLLPIVLFALFKPGSSSAEWFDDNWGYRKEIPVTNNTTVETNVYIAFDNSGAGNPYIDTSASGRFQADCGDIRFTTRDGVILKYIVNSGCTTSSTDVDVLFSSFPAGTQNIYMYYGNSSAVNGFEATGFSTAASNYTIGAAGSEETGPGPIAYWKLDEGVDDTCTGGSNDACDSTPNGNDGTITGATWQTEDKCISGKCLYFDGTNDNVTTTSPTGFPTGANERTISLWFRANTFATDASDRIYSYTNYTAVNGQDIFITAEDNAVAVLFTGHRVITPKNALNTSQWYHVAVVVPSGATSTSDVIVYINGKLQTLSDESGSAQTLNTTTDISGIAGSGSGSANYFHGFIDEIKVYPYARSAAQVKADYIKGAAAQGSSAVLGMQDPAFLNDGLLAYWPLDETSGTSASDASGNNLTATLANLQETGTATSDANTTDTVLRYSSGTTLSSVNDAYNGMILYITDDAACGLSADQQRLITDYDGTNKDITVGQAFSADLDACDYTIRHQIGGKFGNGVAFEDDGGSVYLTTSGELDTLANNVFTVSAWIYSKDSADNGYSSIFKLSGAITSVWSDGEYAIARDDDGNLYAFVGDGAGNSDPTQWSSVITLDEWNFVACGINADRNRWCSVNGEILAGTESRDVVTYSNIGNYTSIGSNASTGGTTSTDTYGTIDEVRVYNRTLSPAEVRALYNWAPGPVGYWNFDEGTGTSTVYDRSGNSYNGTMNGSMTESDWVIGKFGSALDFDNSDDEIDLGTTNLKESYPALTVEAWVKTPGGGSERGIVERGSFCSIGDYGLQLDSDYTVKFQSCDLSDAATDSSVTINDNTWHHLAGVYDGAYKYVYIDGVLNNSEATTGIINHDGAAPDLANRPTGSLVTLDEVRIYNYARTPGQIIEDMNGGHPLGGSPISSQAVYWKLDEMNSSTAYDAAYSTASNGTITNATWTTGTSCKINSCLTFDNAGEVVTIATASDAEVDYGAREPFSGSAWVYVTTMPTSTNGDKDAIIAKWDQNNNQRAYRLIVENDDTDSTGNFQVELMDESTAGNEIIFATTSNDTVSQNTWYHVAFTYNGGITGAAGDLKLYVNGQYKAQNSANTSFLGVENLGSDFTVGEYDTNDNQTANTAFTGLIDEVKMYSGILSADEVMIDYNAGASVNFATKQIESSDLTDGWTNPVAYWDFNENTGTSTTYDKSGNGYDGTLTSITASSWVPGKYGSALTLDGSADFVDVGAGPTSVKSVSFWAYPASTTEYFVDLNGTDYIWVNAGTLTATGFTAPTYYVDGIATQTVAANTWQHITVTDSTAENASDLDIGRLESTDNYEGKIDEVKIFSNELTQAQVAYEYNRGAPVGWWKFDECQGATAYDASGNGYNGTINTSGSLGTCGGSAGDMWADGTTGKLNSSLDFGNADSDYIGITTAGALDFTGSKNITIMAWVNTDTADNNDRIVMWEDVPDGNGTEALIGLVDGSTSATWKATFNLPAPSQTILTGTTEFNDDSGWVHIAATYDGANMKLYANGKLENSRAETDAIDGPASGTPKWIIGRGELDTNRGIDGRIDDVRVYNYALSADQIKKALKDGPAGSGVRFGPATGSP